MYNNDVFTSFQITKEHRPSMHLFYFFAQPYLGMLIINQNKL